MIVARFQHFCGATITVMQADAFSQKCDVSIIGRGKENMERVETQARQRFISASNSGLEDSRRRVSVLSNSFARWRNTVAFHYRPRNVHPMKRYSQHTWVLTLSLCFLLKRIRDHYRPRKLMWLPLSWRNPEVVSVATVAATLKFYDLHISDIRRRMARMHPDSLAKALQPGFWKDESTLKAWQREAVHPDVPDIVLIDKTDPSPFLDMLRNQDGCLEEARESIPTFPDFSLLTEIYPRSKEK